MTAVGLLMLAMLPGAAPDPASISLKVLPEGPNRSLVVERCGLCHPIEMVVAQRRTPDDWQRQVARMLDFGARLTPEEQDQVLDYLETVFGRD
ncbi:MAG: hypothetical protein RL026_2454 [Pseudomonadota bacterium]|jgi:hypothetical protein